MTQHESGRPESGPPPDSPNLPRPEAEQLYDSYITAFAEVDQEQSSASVTMHFITLEGDHIEVTRVPELREIQTVPYIALTALQRILYRKLGGHPSTYDAYLYSLTATSAGSGVSVTLTTPVGPRYVRGKKTGSASARPVDMSRQELIDEAASIREKTARSVCLTDEQWHEIKHMGPCSVVRGEEAEKMQGALESTMHVLLARYEEFTPLKDGKHAMIVGILAEHDTAGDLPIVAVTVTRPLHGEKYQSVRVIFADYPFDPGASLDSKLIVTATTVIGHRLVFVNYSRAHYDDAGHRQQEFVSLDKVQRAQVLASIQRQVRPENLRDQH